MTHREDALKKINGFLKNKEVSKTMEKSVFEFSEMYCQKNGYNIELKEAIYNDKLRNILENLDKESALKNTTFLEKIVDNNVDPCEIAFMTDEEVFPENWDDINFKKQIRDDKVKNMATTSQFKCRKCGERRSTVFFLQTRGGDEPATAFVTCVVCNHQIKFST